VGVRWYLQGFNKNLSEAQLSALTVTSPFSAAFSVPMPARSSWGGNEPITDDAVASLRIPGIGLPLWTVFLIIDPLLCLVLVFVTYLAFRWRWWKAGTTI
jgi:hypothetical protein